MCSRRNTAAASVEATIEPTRRPTSQGAPSTVTVKAPVSPAVMSTPSDARTRAGQPARRKLARGVLRPPSNRMMASAVLPTT